MMSPPSAIRANASLQSVVAVFVAGAMLAGCGSTGSVMGDGSQVTASDSTRLTRSGFLSDYARLKPTIAGEGIECWRSPSLDPKKYDQVMIARMVVTLKAGGNPVDPTDLKALVDYFHGSMTKALKRQMQVVEKPGPGVAVMRIALTDLVPTEVSRSAMGTLVPYGFVAEAGSGVAEGKPAGSTPYLGETGMEMQIRDGASGDILAECRDTQIGRKYAAAVDSSAAGAAQTWASGYLNSFESWAYARNAFDKWSELTARRFAELRGVPAR
jgi:hypothetical protein